MSDQYAFADALDRVMTEQGLHADDVAAKLSGDVSGAMVQEWRDGVRFPCPRNVSALLVALDVPRSRLLP